MSAMHWVLPQDVLPLSIEIMRPHGAVGNEGLALWFGRRQSEDAAVVTHVVDIFGPGFFTTPEYMSLSRRAMSSLRDIADSLDVYLVGQIHSHPGPFIDLSTLDREQGFRVPNYLSLVCPYYAQRATTVLSHCGVHVFEQNGYRRLSRTEVSKRIQLSDNRALKIRHEVQSD